MTVFNGKRNKRPNGYKVVAMSELGSDIIRKLQKRNQDLVEEIAALKGRVRKLEAAVTYRIETDKESQADNQRLREELEQERVRLAGCGVVAMQNTRDSARNRCVEGDYGYSASYGMVCDAVDRELGLQEALKNFIAEIAALKQIIVDMEADARRFPTLAEFSNLQDDNAALKEWKEGAIIVQSRWDKVADEFPGGKWGDNKSDHVLKEVIALKERVRELEAANAVYLRCGSREYQTQKEVSDKLRIENKRLREALENIINETEREEWMIACVNIYEIASEALKEVEG